MTHTPADAALWRAMLAEMPIEVIVAWLDSQGWVLRPKRTHGGEGSQPTGVLSTTDFAIKRVYLDALPPGYPPLADADVPFDGEDRRT